MDLANGHRYLLERMLDTDDDFGRIDNDNPSQSTMTSNVQYNGASQTQSAMDSYIGSTPVLSKSAEAELYLLATNFLLCTSIDKFGWGTWIVTIRGE